MALLDKIAAMTQKFLNREGQTVTVYFVDNSVDDYNPSTGTNTPSTDTSVVTKAVLLPFLFETRGDTTYSGTLIEKEDRECYLSTKVAFPRQPNGAGDYLIDAEGTKWRILVSKPHNPSGVLEIMYKLLLRR